MATTYTKQKLSGSTNGRQIKIAATSTPGTTIHTTPAGTTSWDEIWLWATNSSTLPVKLTIEFGGTTSPDDTIELVIPPEQGLLPILPGLILQNSLVVTAFAATTAVINLSGFVNRITQ